MTCELLADMNLGLDVSPNANERVDGSEQLPRRVATLIFSTKQVHRVGRLTNVWDVATAHDQRISKPEWIPHSTHWLSRISKPANTVLTNSVFL